MSKLTRATSRLGSKEGLLVMSADRGCIPGLCGDGPRLSTGSADRPRASASSRPRQKHAVARSTTPLRCVAPASATKSGYADGCCDVRKPRQHDHLNLALRERGLSLASRRPREAVGAPSFAAHAVMNEE